MADSIRIVVLEGDETGQELLDQAVRVLDPDLLRIDVVQQRFDLSLGNRRATNNDVVTEAAAAMRETGLGLKAATITPEGADDVGSPNRILREQVDGKVIVRTGRRLPGVAPIGAVYYPISVVRMAVEDAYGAKQWREGEPGSASEVAYRTEHVTRSTCRVVAEYAFTTAEKFGARVYGGPKWTVSPVYEGMLKEEMDAAAARHPDVTYQPVLIDATYAGLVSGATDAPLVVPRSTATATASPIWCCRCSARSPARNRSCSRSTTTRRRWRWPRCRTAPPPPPRARTSPTRLQ
jgi:isocitrate dehydrogenase (NAD+)